MSKTVVTEGDLHASIDTQLPASALADIEGWLQAHPHDAERIAQYQAQNAALHTAYDAVLQEDVPEKLRAVLARAAPPHATKRFAWFRHAAVLAALAVGGVVGGIAGWKAHELQLFAGKSGESSRATPAIVRQAVVAHAVFSPEVRHPVEVGVEQEAHLVAWLSKRLGTPLRVPQLGEQGYALVGGRLLPGQPDDRLPVAQFMYQDGKGLRLTLYVRVDASATRETAFRFAQEKNISVFYWMDQKLGYALSGEIEKTELLRVADAIYKQLNP